MPNRRSRPYRHIPNTNPHNPTERFIRPNGKLYYARSPMKAVLYEGLVVVLRTHNPETARRLVEINYPDVILGAYDKQWVKEYSNPASDYYEIEFDRWDTGVPALVFQVVP